MISCLLSSSTSPSQQRCVRCERACEGLGLQVGVSMMSCKIFKHSCKAQVQRFYQRDKIKSWSGLKLSSADGDGDHEIGMLRMLVSCYCLNVQAILPISYIYHWWNHYSSSWFIGWSPQQRDWNQISIWRTSDRVTHRRSSTLIDLIEKWN